MDYNATTPLEPEVIQAITEALQDAWGNPSSSYIAGKGTFPFFVSLEPNHHNLTVVYLQVRKPKR